MSDKFEVQKTTGGPNKVIYAMPSCRHNRLWPSVPKTSAKAIFISAHFIPPCFQIKKADWCRSVNQKQRGEQVQSNPIASEPVDLGILIFLRHAKRLQVAFDVVLHLLRLLLHAAREYAKHGAGLVGPSAPPCVAQHSPSAPNRAKRVDDNLSSNVQCCPTQGNKEEYTPTVLERGRQKRPSRKRRVWMMNYHPDVWLDRGRSKHHGRCLPGISTKLCARDGSIETAFTETTRMGDKLPSRRFAR